MGVPKRKSSKQKIRQRRAANANLVVPNLSECPQCHEFIVPHTVCSVCGYYKNKEVLKIKA
jgi:large subunit ribosomal protein L32